MHSPESQIKASESTNRWNPGVKRAMPRTESSANKKVPESFASALHHQGYYRRTIIISESLQAEPI